MSKTVILAPGAYVQGPGEIKNLATYCAKLSAKKVLLIVDPFVLKHYEDAIAGSFKKDNLAYVTQEFGGECSKTEINKFIEVVKKEQADVIVGVGGGKTLDTAKGVAYYQKLPVVIVPSIASTDAPTSALTVLYKDDGQFDEYLLLPSNPNCVVVDSEVIANAPSRLLVAGMGDALATAFEGKACAASGRGAMAGGKTSQTALALSELCYNVLIENGLKAKLAVDANTTSKAVEAVIEANTYLSGIGFESGGLAAAHAVHNGLTVLEETHGAYHGEKVAFGTIVQIILENGCNCDLQEVIDFCQSVGLPTTFEQLGIKSPTEEKLMAVAKAACAEGETIHNMPFEVTPEAVYSAMVVADKLGQ